MNTLAEHKQRSTNQTVNSISSLEAARVRTIDTRQPTLQSYAYILCICPKVALAGGLEWNMNLSQLIGPVPPILDEQSDHSGFVPGVTERESAIKANEDSLLVARADVG